MVEGGQPAARAEPTATEGDAGNLIRSQGHGDQGQGRGWARSPLPEVWAGGIVQNDPEEGRRGKGKKPVWKRAAGRSTDL